MNPSGSRVPLKHCKVIECLFFICEVKTFSSGFYPKMTGGSPDPAVQMLNTVTGQLQDGFQLPVALLSPCGQKPLVVQGLKLRRPLPEDVVQAGPAALDLQPGPLVQSDATHNLLGPELPQSRKIQVGEDQAPAGGHVQELQRLRLQRVGDAGVPQRHQDVQRQGLQVGQGFGQRLQRGGSHAFKDPEVFQLQDAQLLELREHVHRHFRPVEVEAHLGNSRTTLGELAQKLLKAGDLSNQRQESLLVLEGFFKEGDL